MGGGKGSSPKQPAPIDPGKSMGEYLFGKNFSGSYQGITDPRLQDRLIASEATYRPQYTALELADIGVMARGIAAGTPNPAYKQLQQELAGLKAGAQYSELNAQERGDALRKSANSIFPDRQGGRLDRGGNNQYNREQGARREAYINSFSDGGKASATRIAEIEAQLEGMSPTLAATPGLFDLLEENTTRAGALQRSQLGLQRADDVSALQEFAPDVVEAYRAADPNSTGLAELATARAAQLGLRGPGIAEQELMIMGLSESNLSPTEQEALLAQRGTEFAASTGELTPLEQRNAQQSARQAAAARGRSRDQSSLYGEMQSRMAQEMDKQGREIAMGSQMIGQEAAMRAARLNQGAGFLTGSENVSLQRFNQEQGALSGAFSFNRQLAGDIGNTILGRPSSAVQLGGQMLGQAQQGAAGQMGPQLFDPNVGLNMALQQRGQDVTFQGMQAQADAASGAGFMGAAGSALGGYLSAGCWVAREVYGIENPQWLEFREWMFNDAPSWLRKLYLKYGERTAKFISNKPRVKSIIRKWMNTKIK